MGKLDLGLLEPKNPAQHDRLGVGDRTLTPLLTQLATIAATPERMPHTLGLFGPWGAGKTTLLEYLAFEIPKQHPDWDVVYFNAWRHAGRGDALSALVYKILKHRSEPANADAFLKVLRVVARRARKHLSSISEKHLGVDLPDLVAETVELGKEFTEARPSQETLDALEHYFGQAERIDHDIKSFFPADSPPCLVVIDELDRCDPGEAFEVIKELRLLFGLREVPLLFVMTANPDPIGLAIKHQFGLEGASDYESRRILEKFVDTYVDFTAWTPLNALVGTLWGKRCSSAATVLALDQHLPENGMDARFGESSLRCATARHAINARNRLYSNLRLLSKSHAHVQLYATGEVHPWTTWHLDMLKQADINLRKQVTLLSTPLKNACAEAHRRWLIELTRIGAFHHGVFRRDWLLPPEEAGGSNKGETPFAIYRSFFYEAYDAVANDKNQTRPKHDLMLHLRADGDVMEFFTQLSLIRLSADGSLPHFEGTGNSLETLLSNWAPWVFDAFGRLLNDY